MSATPDINTPTESILEPGQALYLHHSDNPGTILVSQPLNGDNYATWSRSMSMALSAKNKTGFIDGSMPKPNASSTKYSSWVRCNNMVSSWLLNSINPDLAHSVLYTDSAYEIWTDLKERFSQSNAPRIFQIKRSISSHIQGQNSIASYFNKLKGYWDELASYISLPTCSCGALKSLSEHEQREKNLQFLMGLNDTYSAIRGQILLMDPLPSLNKTYSLVLQEERQREITMSTNNVDASALLANAASTGGKRRERPTCENCGWVGHTKAKCYKLHGYPPGHRLHKTGRPTSKQNSSNDDFSRVPPIESVVPSFTPEQYRQILSLLNDGNPVANFADQVTMVMHENPQNGTTVYNDNAQVIGMRGNNGQSQADEKVEKQGSKGGGGYVGGFLQLFDWNRKSRKKLFLNKSDLPGSKQGKKCDENLPMTRLHLIEDENGGSNTKGSCGFSCASSVTDDEGYGTRAPGAVARLMGLDSLPTSNVGEPYYTPFFDSRSLRDAHYQMRNPEFFDDHQIMHSGNQSSKVEGFSRNPVAPKPQKMQNRPIERFQTEILPPKSAKTISITHHKLLSPIKNPGFTLSKNAAHIMEAAAKIIEPGLQASTKSKIPLVGSASVPLKVWDLKEKVEATHRPSRLTEVSRRHTESNGVKYLKGQSLNKRNGSEDTSLCRGSSDSEESNTIGLKNKGKSISLAIQAKVNVQRREGLNSSNSRSLLSQKEHNEVKSSQSFKNQPNTQKSTQKKSSTGVLRQNNQKQNCLTNIDKLPSKHLVSSQQGKKVLSGAASFGRDNTLSKVAGNSKGGSRKVGVEVTHVEKEVSSSRTKNFPRKKRSIDGDFHFEKNGVIDTVLVDKNEKHIQSILATDGHLKWTEDNKRKGMDVVSFTFSSPMIKSMPGSQSSCQVVEKNNISCIDSGCERIQANSKTTKLSSLGLNVIGGDALSILLEQKLRELTCGVESSCCNSIIEGSVTSSVSTLQDLVSAHNAVSTTPREHDKNSHFGLHSYTMGGLYDFDCSSTHGQVHKMSHKLQGVDGMGECSSSNSEARKELDFRHPSPVSILEPSFSNESCNSSDNGDSNSSNGSNKCPSFQAQQVVGSSCPKEFQSEDTHIELLDSASSASTSSNCKRHVTTFSVADCTRSTKWELEYVREILCNVESMFKDFALDWAREIINPNLFDQLENRKGGFGVDGEEDDDSRQRRKVLFDCVSECLDLRFRRHVGGGYRTWAKGVAMVRRKEWLAEEVYKETSGWRSMEDWMVDELVDKDMSGQNGKWVDFEIEAFEVGVEIERGILGSLIDEVVSDILMV
ncbi:hypothetical protein HHK36_026447 [Tetracentron sinense]|uniref:Retrotransposon Copia-like N-terminal domain-containing protein n=1 Tax=Tetracentron sinense TaxID=13715 RepID=A0A834YFG4_TETSI|nr:hypothetical protein HHK36_026447 [Tetracentron sinense]